MPLSANSRLGPYEIRSALGTGGMGEVYRARDPRLNRDVAIKVLRSDGSVSDYGSARFEREARAVAALNHPNIVSVYDFGIENGQQYIVEELVEGESLRSMLIGKPMSIRKLVEIATQVADGLAAAHAIEIVHRDLKPENIMVAKDGRVRILDFGLARQNTSASSARTDSGSNPDATTIAISGNHDAQNLTESGTVLGTARYMSPEQATARETDFRSDQFSFGLILYEMAAGKRAFSKESPVETMAAIVREEPPPMEEKIPPPLRWIIDRCLQKDREQRYESTRDLYLELRDLRDHLSDSYSSAGLAPVAAPVSRHRWRLPAVVVGCMVLAALLGYLLKPAGQDIKNYRYNPFANNSQGAIWSPDGNAVAYEGKVNGTMQVFLRYLNSPSPLQLTHDKLDIQPLGWSSDKSHLIVAEEISIEAGGLEQHVKVYSLPTIGGELEFIMDAKCVYCTVSPDGKVLATIVFPTTNGGNFAFQVSDPLGSPLRDYKPAPFTSTKENLNNNPWISFSPDGKNILLILPTGDPPRIWVLPYPMGSGQPRRIMTLEKLPFNRLYPSSSWMPDARHFVISVASNQSFNAHHLWMADTGSNYLTPITNSTSDEIDPAVSPDGKSILYDQYSVRSDVVSVSIDNGAVSTLVTSGHLEFDPAWSANKRELAWITDRNNSLEIWVRQPDGSDRPAVTAANSKPADSGFLNPSPSPNGDRLIYAMGYQTNLRLWLSSLSGGSPIPLTTAGESMQWGGSWSPDGSRFVYLQNQPGKGWTLMLVKTSGNAVPVVLKESVLALPDWSPAADWITFHDEKGWNLISPDGKTVKFLGSIPTRYLAFSKDGKLLYGVLTGETDADEENRAVLFSLDPATLRQKAIKDLGKDLRPLSGSGVRLSLAPDGKSLVYCAEQDHTDLWMLQRYSQPGWSNRIVEALQAK
jgi:eukaryotic-like serine/threonine-protein kinase